MDNLLTTQDAARYLGIKAGTLATWRCYHTAGRPSWVKVGGAIRYELSELRAWLENNRQGEYIQGSVR